MGFCWPCMTLEGGVYFSASSHICIALFMLGYLVYYHLQSLANYYSSGVASATSSDGFFTICFIYVLILLILGCFIFSGLEKKNTRILKVSTVVFGILHGIIFLRVLYVISSELFLNLTNSNGTSAFKGFGVVFFTFLFFLSFIYLAILTMHITTLQAANNSGNIFSQIQLGVGAGDGNPLYAYNTVCNP